MRAALFYKTLCILTSVPIRQNGSGRNRVSPDMEGHFTTDNMKVVERFTMVDLNQIDYEATITDPTIYTKPWKIAGNLGRHPDANFELMEFACHEGNIDLQHYPESQGGTIKGK